MWESKISACFSKTGRGEGNPNSLDVARNRGISVTEAFISRSDMHCSPHIRCMLGQLGETRRGFRAECLKSWWHALSHSTIAHSTNRVRKPNDTSRRQKSPEAWQGKLPLPCFYPLETEFLTGTLHSSGSDTIKHHTFPNVLLFQAEEYINNRFPVATPQPGITAKCFLAFSLLWADSTWEGKEKKRRNNNKKLSS